MQQITVTLQSVVNVQTFDEIGIKILTLLLKQLELSTPCLQLMTNLLIGVRMCSLEKLRVFRACSGTFPNTELSTRI